MEFTIDPWLVVQLCVGTVLPLLVGLVTKITTNGGLRAVLLAAIALVTSLGTEALAAHNAGTTYDLGQGLVVGLGTFLIAVGMYFGLWKPTGAATAVQAVGSKDPGLNDYETDQSDAQAELDAHLEAGDIDGTEVLDESDDNGVTPDEPVALAATEIDTTPPADDYRPRH